MSNQNGVMVGGVFRTFADIRDVASKASGVMTTRAFTNTTLALLDYIEAQAVEKVRAERAEFMGGAEWLEELVSVNGPRVLRDKWRKWAGEEFDKRYTAVQPHQCTECPSAESNPHSTSLCRDCQIKQLQAILEDERQKLSVLAAEAKYPSGENAGKMIRGTWPKNDPRRGFVDGARWCFYELTGATMFSSERETAEDKAQEWSEAQRPMPTREQIEAAIDENVESADGGSAYGIGKATDAIMALFGMGGGND